MKRLLRLIIGGAIASAILLALNFLLIMIWEELGIPRPPGSVIRMYGLFQVALVFYGAIFFAGLIEDFQYRDKPEDSGDAVFGVEKAATALGTAFKRMSKRLSVAVEGMHEVQKVAIVAVLVMPFLFSREWRYLTEFYRNHRDFEDYSALLGAWLVCAVVYYLWRPKTEADRH